jgi:hypothetical protein
MLQIEHTAGNQALTLMNPWLSMAAFAGENAPSAS